MDRDEEPILKDAFAELHRRQQEQSPPFHAMRDRALRAVVSARPRPNRLQVIAWVTAAAAVMVAATWWIGRQSEPASQETVRVDSQSRVDQLIDSIEQHLDFNAAISSLEFPTDRLLAGNQTDSSP
jgi:ferric-dicitrate binding protein FerR (iron transport regulator)